MSQKAKNWSHPLAIAKPDLIPSRRYYDADFYELEKRHLWSRVWQMACRLEEIPDIGDYVVYRIFDTSVVVVRVDKTTVKAYENACRHRGLELAEDRGNAKDGFNCPFHGWNWDITGKCNLLFQRSFFDPAVVKDEDTNLAEIRCDTWGGFAFINFDKDALDLRSSLGEFAPMHEARNVNQLRAKFWIAVKVPSNWKIGIEAFLESYHVARTHPQILPPGADTPAALEGAVSQGAVNNTQIRLKSYKSGKEVIDGSILYMKTLSAGMGGSMISERDIEVAETLRGVQLPDDPAAAVKAWRDTLNKAIYDKARDLGLPMFDPAALPDNFNTPVNYAFPNFFLLPVNGNAACYRFRPLGPEECLHEIWGLEFFPPGEEPPRPVTPEVWSHDDDRIPLIPAQDYSNIPKQQRGLHAPNFKYMRLAGKVEGLISNYQRLIDGYIAGAEREDLLKAVQHVSGPIDMPIRPLGLGTD